MVLKLKNQLRLTQDLERNSGEERPNGSNSQRTKGIFKTYENPMSGDGEKGKDEKEINEYKKCRRHRLSYQGSCQAQAWL